MIRQTRPTSKIDNRAARQALPRDRRPHGYTRIAEGVWLGYRRTTGAGSWTIRIANGKGDYRHETIGTADDLESADDVRVLDYWQACEHGRTRAGKPGADSRHLSWAMALGMYETELLGRDGDVCNATRVRHHLPDTLLDKSVATLSALELRRWRDSLIAGGMSSATVVRTLKSAKASLNLAADLDPRIRDRSPWKVGLSRLTDTYVPVSKVLADADVRRLVACAYVRDPNFGLLVDVLASTGTRASQACRLLVADLQADGAAPRLMMPSSHKGKGRKIVTRKPVPITPALAGKLALAAAKRDSDAPLLTRADGAAWNPRNRLLLQDPFADVARQAGLACTAYALRHSSIVRALLAGVPARVVASAHDTSTLIMERVYSRFILDHADEVMRRGLIDTAPPAVVSLRRRR